MHYNMASVYASELQKDLVKATGRIVVDYSDTITREESEFYCCQKVHAYCHLWCYKTNDVT